MHIRLAELKMIRKELDLHPVCRGELSRVFEHGSDTDG